MEVSLSLIVRTLRPIPLLSRRLVARAAVRHALSERSRSVRSSFVPQKRIPAPYFPLTTGPCLYRGPGLAGEAVSRRKSRYLFLLCSQEQITDHCSLNSAQRTPISAPLESVPAIATPGGRSDISLRPAVV